jgi:tRNA pseudouridine32 synthase/23S rRNA pseudouridine746 synthase
VTRVELIGTEHVGDRLVGRYRLTPSSGQTHQLRVHLAGLGVGILGDPLYPQRRDVAPGDFSTPLQLLAAEVRFTDPVSGADRRITSGRDLPIT